MTRKLKVASIGEHRNKNHTAQIRLQGKWLVSAGIIPNTHVFITNPKPGILIIHSEGEYR